MVFVKDGFKQVHCSFPNSRGIDRHFCLGPNGQKFIANFSLTVQYIPPGSTPPLSFYGGSGTLVSQYFHPSLIEISVFYMHVLLK